MMECIDPGTLTGPRVFFTSFDNRIVERTSDLDALQRDCERKLKLLLLLKSHVVCSAAHLRSPVAWRIFSQNPFLLRDQHVIPALQEVKSSVREAFRASEDVHRFYEDNVTAVVDWELRENSSWFKQRFIDALTDERSLLRLQAPAIDQELIDSFTERHANKPTLGRDAVYRWAVPLPEAQRNAVLAFREIAYHTSGARVVHCEGALPQEDYVDFDIADLSQRRTRLSEELIFLKIFIELVRDELQQRPLPVEVLDILGFEDIVALRTPFLDSGFRDRYDDLTRAAIDLGRMAGDELVIEDVMKLDAIRAQLTQTFREVLEHEVAKFVATRRIRPTTLASSGASVALGLGGLIPGIGPLASLAALGKDGGGMMFNLVQFTGQPTTLYERIVDREQVLGALAKRGVGRDAVLVDAVQLLMRTLTQRLEL